MKRRIAIDGNLLADCEKLGSIRFGMFRVAEEITKRIIHDPELDLGFANSRQTTADDHLLRAYLTKLSPEHKQILSYLFSGSGISLLERASAKIARKYFPGSLGTFRRFDVFHSFHYPFSDRLKKSAITKSITLLDIIPLRVPGYDDLVPFMKSIVESMVSNFAISISQYSKDDLCDYDKRIDPEKVFVVPLAADRSTFHVNKDPKAWNAAKVKYGLPDNYFLSISGIDKRKNLEHVIYAFDEFVQQEHVNDIHLVMTGNLSFENTIFQKLNISKKGKERIVFSKPIDEPDLSIIYSNARCFFFMSYYEGFGLPALEAMQCGTPVITSNATSIPEVVGEAGIMLPPHDREALSGAMLRIYHDQELRNRYSRLGLERAMEFSWDRCAKEYASIFKIIR